MRRMYSEQELTKVIGDVVDSKIEDGSFDQSIADYIDEYLVEHPIDITALNGKDVSCKSVTTTNNVVVGGNLPVTGNITGASIIENMSGYSAELATTELFTIENVYCGIVKNGNKLTFVASLNITRLDDVSSLTNLVKFTLPQAVANKLITTQIGYYGVLVFREVDAIDTSNNFVPIKIVMGRNYNDVSLAYSPLTSTPPALNTKYYLRVEQTFLLSDSLIS